MRSLLGLVVAAAVAPFDASAQVAVVCTSTSASAPGALTLWLASVAGNPAVRGPSSFGEVSVSTAGGATAAASIASWCTLQACAAPPCPVTAPGVPGTAGVEAIAAALQGGDCRGIVANGTSAILADSVVTCYEASPGMDPLRFASGVWSGTGTSPPGDATRRTINCNTQSALPLLTAYAAVFPALDSAGNFKLRVGDAAAALSPSPKAQGGTPCNLEADPPFYFDASVADAGGVCAVDPPIDPLADINSLHGCRPAASRVIFSGFSCSVACTAGATRVGSLRCRDGRWTPYKCTTAATCEAPQTGNNASIPGLNESHWIVGVADAEDPTAADPGCGVLTEAGAACNYTCDTYEYAGVRASIECGSDGKWREGDEYCGCRARPCTTITASLTLSASLSSTLSASDTISVSDTLSLTESVSLTASATQHPLCEVFDPLNSIFCGEAEVSPFWPWLLLLFVALLAAWFLVLLALRRRKTGEAADAGVEDFPPAIAAEDVIEVGVSKVRIDMPAPPGPAYYPPAHGSVGAAAHTPPRSQTDDGEVSHRPLLPATTRSSTVGTPVLMPETVTGMQSVRSSARMSPNSSFRSRLGSVIIGVSAVPDRRLSSSLAHDAPSLTNTSGIPGHYAI
ncbi:hypothetical protein DIPPA_31251 [Diplonema papillatum]|nr:hypothetical protein DIPPA_31251 [Diplonema papillatum]